MIKQSYPIRSAAVAAALMLCAAMFALAADARTKAGTQVFEGLVNHVSSNNIKVTDPKSNKTLSFLLVPRFNKIFKSRGKTMQQTTLHNGQYVKVYYDQKFLGRPHADRILVLTDSNVPVKKMHG